MSVDGGIEAQRLNVSGLADRREQSGWWAGLHQLQGISRAIPQGGDCIGWRVKSLDMELVLARLQAGGDHRLADTRRGGFVVTHQGGTDRPGAGAIADANIHAVDEG